jgi:hypothetical protein
MWKKKGGGGSTADSNNKLSYPLVRKKLTGKRKEWLEREKLTRSRDVPKCWMFIRLRYACLILAERDVMM